MFRRLSAVVLLGGLIGLVPTSAGAAPARPAEVTQPGSEPGGYGLFHGDDHYRCMYRCGDRRRGRYERQSRRRYCWYHDRHGWYQARCHRPYHRSW
jgi:hypothetical protein